MGFTDYQTSRTAQSLTTHIPPLFIGCSFYEFTCYDGDCVLPTDVCDGYQDCNDGSDEFACGESSFIPSVGSTTSVGPSVFSVEVSVEN